jgi:hypothetical protein
VECPEIYFDQICTFTETFERVSVRNASNAPTPIHSTH